MDSRKRKFPALGLERRVRARADPESDLEEAASDAFSEHDESGSEPETGSETGESEGSEQEESENEGEAAPSLDASKISFGALAKAQASLPSARSRKQRDPSPPDAQEDQDPRGASRAKKPAEKHARAHKHAPAEMSAKRPVSRRREVVPVKKPQARDPRFDTLSGRLDEARVARAYSFLDDYREDEMRQLRAEIKKTKDPERKEELKRRLMSMESKKKAKETRERERAVIEEHRRREKELVKEGKKPFYLKKSEQKKRLLMDRFADMSGKQVEKAIEKKRKKVAGKEKKAMPFSRRVVE